MVEKHKKRAKGFFKGFKEFISKGSIIDLAIGVIIGGAFGKIVSSLVSDIIMPPIGILIGNVDFKDLVIVLKEAVPEVTNPSGDVIAAATPRVTINYGSFIMYVIEFLIIAFTIYAALTLVIRRKAFNEKIEAEEKARIEAEQALAEEEKEEIIPEEIMLLREIRDSLKK